MRASTVTPLIVALGLALSACVSTSLIDRWKDPGYSGPALHKVLVVGVQKDQGRRRVWEDAMVAALEHRGVHAEPSYQVFPDQAPAADQLSSVATRDGFDAVAATHFVAASQRTHFYGGYPYEFGWGPYWGPWSPLYGPGYGAPYLENDYLADYQTDIFTVDSAGGKLIWSGVTRSIDPSSTKGVTDEISHVLVPELVKDGILAGQRH
jgi:hypothetical protein